MHLVTANIGKFREISRSVTEESSPGLGHCGLQCGTGSTGTCRQGSGVFGSNLTYWVVFFWALGNFRGNMMIKPVYLTLRGSRVA
jgi:hypothetical protein